MARYESPSVSVTPRGSAAAGGDSERTVVWLQGDQDAATTKFLVAAFTHAAELDDADVLVDLGAVTFMDASTISVIVGARNRLARRARSLQIRAPSPVASRLLDICGLSHLVRVSPSSAAALSTWIDVPSTSATRRKVDTASTPVPEPAALSVMDSRGP